MFARQSPREQSPHPIDEIQQELERIRQEEERIEQRLEEHEREREELKKIWYEFDKELSALKRADDSPSGNVEASAARYKELEERVDAFRKHELDIRHSVSSLETAVKKVSERTTKESSQFREANLEFHKMLFEVFKLVATLGTGVLIAMTAITVGLFPKTDSLGLFIASCGLIFTSITFSVCACLAQAIRTTESLFPDRSSIPEWSFANVSYWVYLGGSFLGLTLGILLFTQFLTNNLD